jgi:hypothetical protein
MAVVVTGLAVVMAALPVQATAMAVRGTGEERQAERCNPGATSHVTHLRGSDSHGRRHCHRPACPRSVDRAKLARPVGTQSRNKLGRRENHRRYLITAAPATPQQCAAKDQCNAGCASNEDHEGSHSASLFENAALAEVAPHRPKLARRASDGVGLKPRTFGGQEGLRVRVTTLSSSHRPAGRISPGSSRREASRCSRSRVGWGPSGRPS